MRDPSIRGKELDGFSVDWVYVRCGCDAFVCVGMYRDRLRRKYGREGKSGKKREREDF